MSPNRTQGRRILVIDDDPLTREAITAFLELDGFIVESADNGGAGMARLGEFKPELILLDLMMPVVNGWEFLSAKAVYDPARDVPVIIVSGYLTVPHEIAGNHVFRTISKPAEPETIVNAVRDYFLGRLPCPIGY